MVTRTSWLLAAVVLLGAVSPAAGCGVQPSGVIVGVPAPTGTGDLATMYLVQEGKLAQVARSAPQPLSTLEVLTWLTNGPTADETARGFTSEIPPGTTAVDVTTTGSGQEVSLSTSLAALSTMAVDQLVCTVSGGGLVPVTLVSGGTTRGPLLCPDHA